MTQSQPTIDILAGGLGKAFSQQQLDAAYYDQIIVDWDTAFTGQLERSQRNASGGLFVVTMSMLIAWVPTPSASAINGTEFAREALATKASDTWPTYGHLTAKMRFNQRPIGQNVATRVPLLFGTPGDPRYYPYAQMVIGPSETVFVTLANDSSENMKAQLVLEGMVVPR